MLHRSIRFLIVLTAGLYCVAADTTIQADKIVIIEIRSHHDASERRKNPQNVQSGSWICPSWP
jgi:hypothetical protein